MTYVATDWSDGITPVDAAHMDNLEAGVVGAVEKDSVVTAPTRIVASKLLVGDAQPAFKVQGDGRIDWGQGGATALDSNLYRPNPGQLKTDGILNVGGRLFVRVGTSEHINIGENGGIRFGPAEDTNLYRSAADTLKTDDTFHALGNIVANAGSPGFQLEIGNFGYGGIRFGEDAQLFRNTTDQLRTTSHFAIDKTLLFGSAQDTNLYRSAANVLKTDDSLEFQSAFSSYVADGVFGASAVPSKLLTPANNELRFGYSDLGSGQYFPSLGFRVAPTAYNGALEILQARRSDEGNNRFSISHDGHLNWGAGASALDTNLYRSAADTLKTNDRFEAGVDIVARMGNANESLLGYVAAKDGPGLVLGTSADTLLWRHAGGGGLGGPSLYSNRPIVSEMGLQAYGGSDPVLLFGYTGNRIFQVRNSGRLEWGPGGTDAVDVNLYRAAADYLKTDDSFVVGIGAFIDNAGTGAKLYFGSAADTNLYRSAANVLKTDDTFDAAGFTVGGVPLVSGGMTLLNEQILAATASTITFNAIPAGYRKIEIIMEAVPTGANNEVTNFYFDVIPAAPGNWTYATVGQGAGNGSASNANNLHLGTVYYHTAMGAATHQWFCQMEMALGYDQATRHALFYKTISRIGVAGTGGDVGMLRGAAQVRANATHVAITGFTLTSDRAMGIGTRVAVYGVM